MIPLLYRIALRAFPRRHRDLYATEMIDAFDRELAQRAGWPRVSFALAACLNVIATGMPERLRALLEIARAQNMFGGPK